MRFKKKPSRLKRRPINVIAEKVITQTEYYEKRYLDNPYLDIFAHLRCLGNTSYILDTVKENRNVVVIVINSEEATRLRRLVGVMENEPPFFYGVSGLTDEKVHNISRKGLPVIVDPSALLYYPSVETKIKPITRIEHESIKLL